MLFAASGSARAAAVAAAVFWAVAAQAKRNVTAIEVRFVPPPAAEASRPRPSGAMLEHPVAFRLADGRPSASARVLGTRTDGADRVYELTATNDVAAVVEAALADVAGQWGLDLRGDARFRLVGKLVQLEVLETNRAFGAAFDASVRLEFELLDADGRVVWSGACTGNATRTGRKFSSENCNEALSDALVAAFAMLVDDARLQAAWPGAHAP
jgi:hypothetical protein